MRLSPPDHRRSKKRLEEGSDPELNLLYYLFVQHHWTPEQWRNMSAGAQDLTWGLASYEAESLAKK